MPEDMFKCHLNLKNRFGQFTLYRHRTSKGQNADNRMSLNSFIVSSGPNRNQFVSKCYRVAFAIFRDNSC